MTIQEIQTSKEGQTFDCKSIQIEPKALAIPIVTFANADGGMVAIGVTEKLPENVKKVTENSRKLTEKLPENTKKLPENADRVTEKAIKNAGFPEPQFDYEGGGLWTIFHFGKEYADTTQKTVQKLSKMQEDILASRKELTEKKSYSTIACKAVSLSEPEYGTDGTFVWITFKRPSSVTSSVTNSVTNLVTNLDTQILSDKQ